MTIMRTPGSVNHDAIQAAAAAWLARKDDVSTWTEEHERSLQDWLNSSSAHMVAWLRLQSAWQIADDIRDLPRPGETDTPAAPAGRPLRAPRRRAWMGIAASIMFLGVVGLVANLGVRGPSEEQFITAIGARQDITLSDGSRVTLNTRTKARALVNSGERKFWLDSGEAFFEIQHDPVHPFVITAGGDRITVLGTKFSVRHEDGRTQVTVLEGRVRLDRVDRAGTERPSASTTLTKNDAAVSQVDSVMVATKSDVQTQKDLSWREGRLEFENVPLREIAAEFNRYNRRQLIVNEDAAALRLSVRFDPHNIDGFVRLIQTGFGVVAHSEGDEVRLSMK
ncbi:FecR family protein [Roseateles sp. P5_E11]